MHQLETAPGFVVPFAKALGWKLEAKGDVKVDLNNSTLKGKKFLGLIGHEVYKGVTKNVIDDFRPMV